MSESKPPQPPSPDDPISSTLHHVQQIQSAIDTEVSWQNLHDKVVRWVTEASYGHSLPPDKSRDDLVQEVLLQVFRDIQDFQVEPGASFGGWVRTITQRKLNDSWRRAQAQKRGGKGRLHHLGQLGDEEDPPQFADENTPRQSMLARYGELQQAVQQAVAQLSDKHKQVIELRMFQGKSYAEIAPMLGYDKEVTVRSLYLRAAQRLQELLRDFA